MGELHREKNVATYITFPLVDANGALVAASANPDSEIDAWTDGGAPDGFADCTNEATEIAATGIYYLLVTQTEMNNDYIIIQVKSDDALTQVILINTKLRESVETVDGVVDSIATDTAAILIDTDTMEADLKTYMDTIETNLEGDIEANDTLIDTAITDIAAVKGDTAAILIDTDTMEADLTTEIDANETKIDTAISKIDTIDGIVDNILTDTGSTLDGKINTIDTNVDSILTDTGTTLDTLIKEIAGLCNKNVYIDTTVFSGGNMTSGRLRLYNSAANATTHGATGLLYTATITATYTGNNLTTYLVTVA